MAYSNSITCFKDDRDTHMMDPQALAGLNSLFGVLDQSDMQLSTEIKKTQEVSQQVLEKLRGYDALAAENIKLHELLIQSESRYRQLELTYQSQIKASETKSQLAEQALVKTQQELADLVRKTKSDLQEALKAKEEAVKVVVQTGEARLNLLKDQIKRELDNFYFHPNPIYPGIGHRFNRTEIETLSRGQGPICSCHNANDQSSYFNAVFERWRKTYPNPEDWCKLRHDGEHQLRKDVSYAFKEHLDKMNKICS